MQFLELALIKAIVDLETFQLISIFSASISFSHSGIIVYKCEKIMLSSKVH